MWLDLVNQTAQTNYLQVIKQVCLVQAMIINASAMAPDIEREVPVTFSHSTSSPAGKVSANIAKPRQLPVRNTGSRYRFRIFMVWTLSLWSTFCALVVWADITATDRRRDQFPSTAAHLIVPLPYSYPGIGDGFFLMGNFSNILDTTADFLAMSVTGDAGGYILQLDEVPVIERRLYIKLYYQHINRAVVNQYDTRGMEGSGKNDYTLLDATLALEKTINLNLTFFDRRLNLLFTHTGSEFEIKAIRDYNGDLITELAEPYHGKDSNQILGVAIDLTDDYLDPLQGTRFSLNYQDWSAEKTDDPSYYVLTYNMQLYLPMLETDTLVLNYFQSDAHVTKEGNTNPADIRAELGLNCDPSDTQCLESEQNLVDSFIKQRTNGTAAALGGKDRLRSYPEGRFHGGHSAFIGAEYRLNFKQGVAPFNYLFWKDVRTGLQVALFGEVGSVSETPGELWQETRYSYGMGLRLVAASGSVYRADLAYGDEGSEFTVFFFYPW